MLNTTHSALDFALADFFTDRCGFFAEEKAQFNTVILRLSSEQSSGHSCIALNDEDLSLLRQCRLVYTASIHSEETSQPLVLEGNRLYLNRYWRYETRLVANILQRVSCKLPALDHSALLDKYFPVQPSTGVDDVDWQREAAKCAAQQSFTIITGGPGTGKTTTVLKVLALLQEMHKGELSIALAAPTGKAAMRLQQSLFEGKQGLELNDQALLDSIPETVTTLHRLLGSINQSSQFRHNADKPLSCDLLVVDESSMIDLAMMSKLLDALKPTARLILLGDKDQLASVESGAVLNDLCNSLPEQTVELKKTWRFSGPIKELAQAINTQQANLAWTYLSSAKNDNAVANTSVNLLFDNAAEHLYQQYQPYIQQILTDNDPEQAMNAFSKFQVLAAVREGEFGVEGINLNLERRLRSNQMQTQLSCYHGKPIMITRNDSSLGLFNGDIGICLNDDKSSQLNVWFKDNSGGFRAVMPARLPQHETVFAMTIHKSQGSEFNHVMLVLPNKSVPILSKALLYTGITRAKQHVDLATSEGVFKYTVNQQVIRNSGIRYKIQAATVDN